MNPRYLAQGTWTNPLTSRLLLEGGFTFLNETWYFGQHPAIVNGYGSDAVISKNESSINVTYGAANTFTIGANHQYNMRGAANYVTGSHAFKVGIADMWGSRNYRYDTNQAQSWAFTNGVPTTITEYARPQIDHENLRAALALYGQDRWTLGHVTLNLGLRFDYHDAYVPAQSYPAIPFVAARTYDPISDVPRWKDISPRIGGTYDLAGNGRTVVRANYAKYIASESTNMATLNNPVNTSINTATRRWTDNGNFVPDCDLHNPVLNGECGPLSAPLGALNIVTHYDPAIISAWGVRPNDHEVAAGVQHEIVTGLALDFQFTRHSFGNFFATQNRALPPALAYSSYCVGVPVDARLPASGGQICGFMDVNPAPYFGATPDNYTTKASNFGKVEDAYTGYDVNATARLAHGGMVSGGVSLGHEVSDICAVVGQANVGYAPLSGVNASSAGTLAVAGQPGVPSTLYCHVEPPFQADAKAFATYPLPWWGLTASATLQSRPGPVILASYVVSTNAGSTAQPIGLGRPLSLGTATTQLIGPGTMYGDRVNQVDIRFGKIFTLPHRARLRTSIDVFNLMNTSAILAINTRYSTTNNAWLTPTQILQGRLLKLGAQLDF